MKGAIPSQISTLTQLDNLELQGNSLNGQIPSALSSLTALTILWLHYNELTGSLPTQLTALKKLSSLFFNNNRLSSSIPSEFCNFSSPSVITFNDNSFSCYPNCLRIPQWELGETPHCQCEQDESICVIAAAFDMQNLMSKLQLESSIIMFESVSPRIIVSDKVYNLTISVPGAFMYDIVFDALVPPDIALIRLLNAKSLLSAVVSINLAIRLSHYYPLLYLP